MFGDSDITMSVDYYSMDPAFDGRSYPECGTTGYDGKGWYYFHGGQLWGPFNSEKEARNRQDKPADIDGWENEGGK